MLSCRLFEVVKCPHWLHITVYLRTLWKELREPTRYRCIYATVTLNLLHIPLTTMCLKMQDSFFALHNHSLNIHLIKFKAGQGFHVGLIMSENFV